MAISHQDVLSLFGRFRGLPAAELICDYRPHDQFNQKLLAADTLAEIVLKRPDVIDGSPAVFQTWATSTLRARSSCIFVVAYRLASAMLRRIRAATLLAHVY